MEEPQGGDHFGEEIDMSKQRIFVRKKLKKLICLLLLAILFMGCSNMLDDFLPALKSTKRIFWSTWDMNVPTHGSIKKAEINNPLGTRQIVTDNFDYTPSAMEVDSINKKIYWVNNFNGYVHWANLDGSQQEAIINDVNWIYDLCLDTEREKIYWVTDACIKKTNLNGSGLISSFDNLGPGASHNQIAIDVFRKRLYWTRGGGIYSANLDCNNSKQIISEDTQNAMALHPYNKKIYWVPNLAEMGFMRADLDGSNIEHINIGEQIGLNNFVIDIINYKIYFASGIGGLACIKQCNLDGTDIKVFITEDPGISILSLALEYD
jgi:hypothetical protein